MSTNDHDERLISRLVGALAPVPGVSAIVLGGSRARGTAGPRSDFDIGLYYAPEEPLDVSALRDAVAALVDDPAQTCTAIGEWGPWINGGGWLTIGGIEVDLLYRDLGKVEAVVTDCEAGRFTIDYQVGHPHGFCSAILAGEAAIAVPLHDANGRFTALKTRASQYPPALRAGLVARFAWEVDFAIENAQLAARRGEQTHIMGCAYRALSCLAQVVFALNSQYLINEKGAVPQAARLPATLPELAEQVEAIWKQLGDTDHAGGLTGLESLSRQLHHLISAT